MRFDAIYVSDLWRTQQTFAEMAKHGIKGPVVNTALIREKAGGEFEGQPHGKQFEKATELGIPIREFKPEGGESPNMMLQRAREFLKESIACTNKDNADVLVVTHGGFIGEIYNAFFELQG